MKYSNICLKGGGREFLLPQAQLLRSGEKLKRHEILLLQFLSYEAGCQCEKRIIEQDANVDVGVMICVSSLSFSLFSFFSFCFSTVYFRAFRKHLAGINCMSLCKSFLVVISSSCAPPTFYIFCNCSYYIEYFPCIMHGMQLFELLCSDRWNP